MAIMKHAVVIITGVAMLLLTFTTSNAFAKRGDKQKSRSDYYGIVQEKPKEGKVGPWVIGSSSFLADSRTEIDEANGELLIGSCAKVKEREDRVHEIESEPMRSCQ